MRTIVHTRRFAILGLSLLGLACGDAPTGSSDRTAHETLVVSVDGIANGDVGIVLRFASAVQSVEPTRASLEIGWATDETGGTTVVVIGALSKSSDLLLVRRRATGEPLRAAVIEVADVEGTLSQPAARAFVRGR